MVHGRETLRPLAQPVIAPFRTAPEHPGSPWLGCLVVVWEGGMERTAGIVFC